MQLTREAILKAIEPRLVDINDVRNWDRMKEEKRLRQQAMYDREFALLGAIQGNLSVSQQDHPLEDPVPALSKEDLVLSKN